MFVCLYKYVPAGFDPLPPPPLPFPVSRGTRLNPEETLVIVVSKTFTTAETMLNARTMKDWLISSIKGKTPEEVTRQHIVSTAAVAIRCDGVSSFFFSSTVFCVYDERFLYIHLYTPRECVVSFVLLPAVLPLFVEGEGMHDARIRQAAKRQEKGSSFHVISTASSRSSSAGVYRENTCLKSMQKSELGVKCKIFCGE